jgi:UDP-N-acetylmuramoyl-L-alanyl-D-glutamate--2,6-diaminopimelate ligase
MFSLAIQFKEKTRRRLPNAIVNYFYHWPKAVLANLVYGWPSKEIKVIGVTGTDGKTTTASLIYHILIKSGYQAGLLTSVEAKYGHYHQETGLHVTSPDPLYLQRIIRNMKNQGMEYLILETTSHALDQYRVWGMKFQIAVITNVTPEHLDYHKTFSSYLKTKIKLLVSSQTAVVNLEDQSGPEIIKQLKDLSSKPKIVTYGRKKGDYCLKEWPIETKLPGAYNLLNCLAATAVCSELGLDRKAITQGMADFSGVRGRMELIPNKLGLKIVVDFAHTPNALKNVLSLLKSTTRGRLISVFGCAGLRDGSKRKPMGRISCQLADITILTAEDPRTEKLSEIFRQMITGCRLAGSQEIVYQQDLTIFKRRQKIFLVIPDRQQAITYAIKTATKGDTVAIFGKGHESSMCYGCQEVPWSDHQAVETALKERIKNHVKSL